MGRHGGPPEGVSSTSTSPTSTRRWSWPAADTMAGAHAGARLHSPLPCAKADAGEPCAYLRGGFAE